MATTDVELYRSLMGTASKLKVRGNEPDPGMLDPRWEATSYKSQGVTKVSNADVSFVTGPTGLPLVDNNGKGTSLHDISKWFNCAEFHIPHGTEYSEEILIVRDKHKKTCKDGRQGYHYMLTARTRMTQETFSGYLNNMARAAVVRQVELANI